MIGEQDEYMCLIGSRGQYIVCHTWERIPFGLEQIGPNGSKAQCLEYTRKPRNANPKKTTPEPRVL